MKIKQRIRELKIRTMGNSFQYYSASAMVNGQYYVMFFDSRPTWKQVMQAMVDKLSNK